MRMLLLLLAVAAFSVSATTPKNLILVTIDGVRWQEVFNGADAALLDSDFSKHKETLKAAYWRDSAEARRQALMPFFWETLASQGSYMGDRNQGSKMRVANPWYFSYPGYSEMVTGVVDEQIDSNDKLPNPQRSFLEYLKAQPGYQATPAVFASWDVFPAIFNRERSGLYINAGFETAEEKPVPALIQFLGQLQAQIPSPWESVRLDAFTYHYAKDYLLRQKPRVMMLALGEPDDFAHDGNYDEYLHGIHRADRLIADLWATLQSTPGYKDNTVMMVTTDHGRGQTVADWQHHSSRQALAEKSPDALVHFPEGIVGSEQIWLAAIGPGIKAQGLLRPEKEPTQAQIAATALTLLGEDPNQFNPKAATPIKELMP